MIEASENFIAIQALRKEYARKLLMLELHMSTVRNNNKASECDEKSAIRKYCMETPNRRNFIMHCCLATLNNKCISVSQTQKSLGMTDPGMRNIVKECLEKKYILLDKNKSGHRRVKATKITLETWMDYSNYVSIMSNEFDFVSLNASLMTLQKLPK